MSNSDKFDDKDWEQAEGVGGNGALPWGERPGIAKKAMWITAAELNANSKTATIYCRVDSKRVLLALKKMQKMNEEKPIARRL